MKDEIKSLVEKAKRSLAAARRLLSDGDNDFSASRSYYAMFYIAEALLMEKGLTFSRHTAVISGFHEHFIKTGIFPKELHKAIHEAFLLRQEGDYMSSPIDKKEAEELINNAEIFITRGITILQEMEA